MGSSKEHWEDQAACKGSPELFTVADYGSVPDNHDKLNKWKAYEKSKFEKAISICQTCTVQQQCGESAGPEEWQWTVRAARMPGAFNTRPQGRPVTRPAPISPDTCSRGHVGRMSTVLGRERRCYACEQEAKYEKIAPHPRQLKNECARGHKGMYERDKRNVRFCRGCKREDTKRYDEKRYAKKKAEGMW